MTVIRTWLIGRKTYLLSGAGVLVTLILVVMDRLTPEAALTLLLLAAFWFPATFKAYLVRHHQEEMELLTELAATGAAVVTHNYTVATAAGQQTAKSVAGMVREYQAEDAAQ